MADSDAESELAFGVPAFSDSEDEATPPAADEGSELAFGVCAFSESEDEASPPPAILELLNNYLTEPLHAR